MGCRPPPGQRRHGAASWPGPVRPDPPRHRSCDRSRGLPARRPARSSRAAARAAAPTPHRRPMPRAVADRARPAGRGRCGDPRRVLRPRRPRRPSVRTPVPAPRVPTSAPREGGRRAGARSRAHRARRSAGPPRPGTQCAPARNATPARTTRPPRPAPARRTAPGPPPRPRPRVPGVAPTPPSARPARPRPTATAAARARAGRAARRPGNGDGPVASGLRSATGPSCHARPRVAVARPRQSR